LRDLKKRGMRAPELAVGDGALGFWGAIRDVFPTTRHQRDWVHKTSNVLDSLPKSVHGRAKAAIKEITEAEDKKHAEGAIEEFASEFGAKWPKAVSKIVEDKDALLTFYDYPARVHLSSLAAFEDHQPHRVSLRTGQSEDRHHQGAGLERGRAFDDLQADRGRRGKVAQTDRRSLGGTGQGGSKVRGWRASRKK